MKKIALLALSGLIGCVTSNTHVARKPAADDPAQIQTAQPDQIAVYVGDAAIQNWAHPADTFNIQSKNETVELSKLEKFLDGKIAELGGPQDGGNKLKLSSVLNRGNRTVVRYEQAVKGASYTVPVRGAGLVINLINGKIISIASSLAQPPKFAEVFDRPGFDTSDFTNNEYAVLLRHALNSASKQKIVDRLQRLGRDTKTEKEVASYLHQPDREKLAALLSQLGPRATARLMIEMAQKGRIAFVKRDGHWMYVVENIFDLPVEFDMEIPETGSHALKVRNLRERHQNVTINVYNAPNYPSAPVTGLVALNSETGRITQTNGMQTAAIFQTAINYFKRYHNWLNYTGKDPNGQLNIYLNVQAPQVADNAAWVPDFNVVLIGPGGQTLKDPQLSYSILGHEYTHAIVFASSKLVYEGESGALNEHFADIQGSYLAGAANGRNFTYEIGAGSLNPSLSAPRELIIQLFLAGLRATGQNVDQAEVQKYSLEKAPVRHLRYPQLSITPSINDMDTAIKTFGTNCQPSTDNDHCGVHLLSGIPNRAVAQVIDILTPDRARQMIFNTVVFRLNAHSTFKEYVRQMYEECLITKGMDRTKDCGVIIQAFNEAGVTYPVAQPEPPVNYPGPPPKREEKPIPDPKQPAASPTLTFCGWVLQDGGNYAIVDNKYNVAIAVNGYAKTTQGNYRDVARYKCACVTGQFSQQTHLNGGWTNYFTNVNDVQERTVNDCRSIKLTN